MQRLKEKYATAVERHTHYTLATFALHGKQNAKNTTLKPRQTLVSHAEPCAVAMRVIFR